MNRAAYLFSLLDRRDRRVLAGFTLAALVGAGGLGYVTGVLRAREAREAACEQRVQAEDARHRARGLQVVRMAAMPCAYERSGR